MGNRLILRPSWLTSSIRITEEVKLLPIYEYECACCSFRFELKRSFSENTPVSCPQCEGNAERVFSPVPIVFKGSGFYSTDSRQKDNRSSDEGTTDKTKGDSTEKGS